MSCIDVYSSDRLSSFCGLVPPFLLLLFSSTSFVVAALFVVAFFVFVFCFVFASFLKVASSVEPSFVKKKRVLERLPEQSLHISHCNF